MKNQTVFNETSRRHNLPIIETTEVLLAGKDTETECAIFAGDYAVHEPRRHRVGVRLGEGGNGGLGKHESRLA